MTIDGLDEPCGTCQRPAGDHTLREWNTCLGTVTTDLPYQATPPDLATVASAAIRRQFALDDDIMIADHAIVRALTLAGHSGAVSIRLPALLTEFQIGVPGQPPHTIAKILFAGSADGVKGYGRLVRDSANGAYNAATRENAGD